MVKVTLILIIAANKVDVPSKRDIINRTKQFYRTRRGSAVIRDEDKLKKRRWSLKASRRTFVSFASLIKNGLL